MSISKLHPGCEQVGFGSFSEILATGSEPIKGRAELGLLLAPAILFAREYGAGALQPLEFVQHITGAPALHVRAARRILENFGVIRLREGGYVVAKNNDEAEQLACAPSIAIGPLRLERSIFLGRFACFGTGEAKDAAQWGETTSSLQEHFAKLQPPMALRPYRDALRGLELHSGPHLPLVDAMPPIVPRQPAGCLAASAWCDISL